MLPAAGWSEVRARLPGKVTFEPRPEGSKGGRRATLCRSGRAFRAEVTASVKDPRLERGLVCSKRGTRRPVWLKRVTDGGAGEDTHPAAGRVLYIFRAI